MKPAIEIYKLLPRTNCGSCGTSSCFGYAAKLASGQAKSDDCMSMTEAARTVLRGEESQNRTSTGTVFEQTLQALRPKVAALDFARVADTFGARLVAPDMLSIIFLNSTYSITRNGILDSLGREPEPFLSILICNHLCMPNPPAPSHEWISFSSIPASHAKDKAWAGHVEDVISIRFSGDLNGLRKACEGQGGTPSLISGSHDAAYQFLLFPRYPALLLFYDAVQEENFPAQCKLLLDGTADKYLDIESIVVLGEVFAGRLSA